MNPMHILGSMPVFVDDSVVGSRNLASKYWMAGRCYQRRVQKKWDKRFGRKKFIKDGDFISVNGYLVMNSVTFAMVEEARP